MKKLFILFLFIPSLAFAADTSRASMAQSFGKPVMTGNAGGSGRAGTLAPAPAPKSTAQQAEVAIVSKDVMAAQRNDADRKICQDNNKASGGAFIWASVNSGTGLGVTNAGSLREDTTNRENNTCWIRVDISSTDAKIAKTAMTSAYFPANSTVTCGGWLDEEAIKKAVLDAHKGGRIAGTIGGVLGGAAIGVGAMELFGNKAIGVVDKSESIEKMSTYQLIAEAKKTDPAVAAKLEAEVERLNTACKQLREKLSACGTTATIPQACNEV